jgi:hypothetical protein
MSIYQARAQHSDYFACFHSLPSSTPVTSPIAHPTHQILLGHLRDSICAMICFISPIVPRLQKKISPLPCCQVNKALGCFANLGRAQLDGSFSVPEAKNSKDMRWEQILQEKGSPECQQCQGTGEILCPACEGKGYFVMEVFNITSSNQCQVCRGHRKAPCPTCKEYIYRAVNDNNINEYKK